MTMSLVIAVR